ncbi:PAS domain S-box protein [Streptomyces sp. NPDC051776]|uniref:helix-turn-helix transcriptional regulator n=1 Tax=Streptomyces sp. NPDC051776 TaxID=3155414 RepID=UPI003448A359
MSFDKSGVHMVTLDRRLAIRQANQEFFREFGRSSEEICGRNFCELVHPSGRQSLTSQFSRLIEGRRHRFATDVIAVGPDSAFTVPLVAVAVRGRHTSELASILVLMRTAQDSGAVGVVIDRRKMLSEIDARILEGIAAGVPTIPLARRLYLSRQGVEYHVTRLLRSLGVPNRSALVSRAYSMGVLKFGTWPPKVVEDYVK